MTTFLNELAIGQNLAEQNGNNCFKNAYVWLKTIFLINLKEQYRLVFSNLKKALETMGSNSNRMVNMSVFLKNMDSWGEMNAVYREFVKSCPTRAAIGIQNLNKTYQIEIVNVIAYKVAK